MLRLIASRLRENYSSYMTHSYDDDDSRSNLIGHIFSFLVFCCLAAMAVLAAYFPNSNHTVVKVLIVFAGLLCIPLIRYAGAMKRVSRSWRSGCEIKFKRDVIIFLVHLAIFIPLAIYFLLSFVLDMVYQGWAGFPYFVIYKSDNLTLFFLLISVWLSVIAYSLFQWFRFLRTLLRSLRNWRNLQ